MLLWIMRVNRKLKRDQKQLNHITDTRSFTWKRNALSIIIIMIIELKITIWQATIIIKIVLKFILIKPREQLTEINIIILIIINLRYLYFQRMIKIKIFLNAIHLFTKELINITINQRNLRKTNSLSSNIYVKG